MTDDDILEAEEMLEGQTTFNESNENELIEEGSVENVCYPDETTE